MPSGPRLIIYDNGANSRGRRSGPAGHFTQVAKPPTFTEVLMMKLTCETYSCRVTVPS